MPIETISTDQKTKNKRPLSESDLVELVIKTVPDFLQPSESVTAVADTVSVHQYSSGREIHSHREMQLHNQSRIHTRSQSSTQRSPLGCWLF